MNFIISEIQPVVQNLANDTIYRFQIPQICLVVQNIDYYIKQGSEIHPNRVVVYKYWYVL